MVDTCVYEASSSNRRDRGPKDLLIGFGIASKAKEAFLFPFREKPRPFLHAFGFDYKQ